MVAICEDLPDESNRVTLDPTLTDANCIAAPACSYRLSDDNIRMTSHAAARAADVLEAAGAQDVITESPLALAGWHLMGTCRMGPDPETSVVNEWGRSHDVKNLFIVDGSIFVTAGG